MLKGTFILGLFWLVCTGLLSACGSAVQYDQPPEMRYGEDVCDQCNMIISEARYAAAYYTQSGEVRRFDGVGELSRYLLKHQEETASIWVHDYETEAWLAAEQAYYVIGPELQTPMGDGAVALGERERANALAAQVGGEVMDFAGVMEHFKNAPAGMH